MEGVHVFISALFGKFCIPGGVWKEAVTGHPWAPAVLMQRVPRHEVRVFIAHPQNLIQQWEIQPESLCHLQMSSASWYEQKTHQEKSLKT